MLRGARQVGKSWLVRDWGGRKFDQVVELNLERRPEFHACFADNDPEATLARLEVLLADRIPPDGSALLFLDEVQAAPGVLSKLRWFAEEMPQLPVIAAGSLLDFALRDPALSVPVGRITYVHLEPMGFREFCIESGEERLAEWLRAKVDMDSIAARTAMPEPLHERAALLFRHWMLVGGMPAAVASWCADRSFVSTAAVHRDLLAALRDDFAKYSALVHHRRLTAVLSSVPRQLGGKFSFAEVDRDERPEALRKAVDLLCLARVCHRVRATPAHGVPLGAGADERIQKLLHLDVGLASTDLGLALQDLERAEDVTLAHRGGIAEQAVGQLLRLTFPPNAEPVLHWWRRAKAGSQAELDYVHSHGARVLPVEVKSGAAGSLKSLHVFMADRGLDWALRVNSAPPVVESVEVAAPTGKRASYRLLSIPVYLVEELPRLCEQL